MSDRTDTVLPWYQRVRRWGQTNITENDPLHYDLDFWREHWQRTRTQGVIVNAGGIVAYYPSAFPLQYRAQHLGGRDLFGEVTQAAREAGLVVLARMDSNRALEDFYRVHPDWFTMDAGGAAYRAQERYIACVNSPYYHEYLPQVLQEIIDRYHPDGFTDNSWSGLGRERICYCPHCAQKFAQTSGQQLPREANWDDPAYRQWIRWSYACRLGVWDLNNRITRQHGGEDCLWLGMLNGDLAGQSRSFHDLPEIGRRSPIIMCDHQSRDSVNGFERNGLNGKLLHGVLGWDKLIPESMAMYSRGARAFRVSANPAEESRMWMIEGFAGGISPWWHHIAARHEDRRQYETAPPVMQWHQRCEQYLYDREPVATVGILWSHQNIDFYGRDDAEARVASPMRGWTSALTRHRIAYLPLHADQIDQYADRLSVIILPNLAILSPSQCQSLRRFVERGGGLIATGQSSLCDEWGNDLQDFALADLLGVHATGKAYRASDEKNYSWEVFGSHTYLRLAPGLNQTSTPPAPTSAGAGRHAVWAGFEQTDIIPFGGVLQQVETAPDAVVLATFVPPFPIYPPEFCWMRTPQTSTPAVVVRQGATGGRVAYLPADIDRCYGQMQLPDHGALLANLVRWAAQDRMPLRVSGPGFIDCHLYRQGDRLILHLVNLTHCRNWPGFVEENVAVGPLAVAVKSLNGRHGQGAKLLVADRPVDLRQTGDWLHVDALSVLDHEVIVIE